MPIHSKIKTKIFKPKSNQTKPKNILIAELKINRIFSFFGKNSGCSIPYRAWKTPAGRTGILSGKRFYQEILWICPSLWDRFSGHTVLSSSWLWRHGTNVSYVSKPDARVHLSAWFCYFLNEFVFLWSIYFGKGW